ncbi:MAG: hypothetical protein PHT88_01770 [Candidatus Moranbacteria bacterium]|nr:hypothetical protein [Candidatus Moranbacteria bacterium]
MLTAIAFPIHKDSDFEQISRASLNQETDESTLFYRKLFGALSKIVDVSDARLYEAITALQTDQALQEYPFKQGNRMDIGPREEDMWRVTVFTDNEITHIVTQLVRHDIVVKLTDEIPDEVPLKSTVIIFFG